MRLALALAVAAVAAAAAVPSAGAARECEGLDVCIPVAGPWVAIPSALRAGPVEYRLACPRNAVVGGLDALVSDRRLDLSFLGALGSPVGPGVSTTTSAVFIGRYVGRQRLATSFRPFIGCIPRQGGGGRETTAVRPGRPLTRRVRTLRVRTETARLTYGCARGERLIASLHALAFRTRREPAPEWIDSVRVTRVQRAGRVAVTAARGDLVPRGTRIEVQVHALCARSGS